MRYRVKKNLKAGEVINSASEALEEFKESEIKLMDIGSDTGLVYITLATEMDNLKYVVLLTANKLYGGYVEMREQWDTPVLLEADNPTYIKETLIPNLAGYLSGSKNNWEIFDQIKQEHLEEFYVLLCKANDQGLIV